MRNLAQGDFEQAPFLVIWEVTRACDLACKHCRAEAVTFLDPRELSTKEAMQLMDRVQSPIRIAHTSRAVTPNLRQEVTDVAVPTI
jgi:AdoMet-dependent heme synthase